MEDLFKKFIYAGVGFVSRTNDRVQDTINQLVQENKLSQKEGAKILEALQKNTDTKRKEFETQINSIAKRVMKTMGVASNSDVEELKRAVKGPSAKATAAGSEKKANAGKKAETAAPAAKATAAKTPAAKAPAAKKAAGSKSAPAKKAAAPAASEGAASTNA